MTNKNDDYGSYGAGDEELGSISSGNTSNRTHHPKTKDETVILSADENRRVSLSRLLVLIVLISSAGLTSGLVWKFLLDRQEDTFRSDFRGFAAEIIEVSKQAEINLVNTMEDYSASITATTLALNQTWPYVTIPHFEHVTAATRKVIGAYNMDLTTQIPATSESRLAFSNYLDANMDWYTEALELTNRADTGLINSEIMQLENLTHYLRQFHPKPPLDDPTPVMIPAADNDAKVHMIHTQFSPPPVWTSHRIKTDFPAFLSRWNYMNDMKKRARSPVFDIFNLYVEEQDIPDPMAFFYQPIFTDFGPQKTLGAFSCAILRWQDHFDNLLHDSASGIIVVLDNTCGQVFKWEVNGPKSTYLGQEDGSNLAFQDIGIRSGLTVEDETDAQSENGVHCGYSITIYPSEKLRDQYRDNQPLLFTLAVICIFAFTTIVFMMYDFLVQRRQNTVMTSAVRTNAIVDGLFPSQFRDRLEQQDEQDHSSSSNANRNKGHLQAFVSSDKNTSRADYQLENSKPVADLFPHATVMFADIQGFTAWSSVRAPTQVFTLLESFYRKMDGIAKRRGVFKIETIGDCYVAVAGVPTPRKDHALAVTRFAKECCLSLPEVAIRLERILGPGTGDLRMRFGLHSGQVTAGVLRGDKARFQLFGDTVNTAARVESTGSASRVHLSEATAKYLVRAGKGSWLIKREDKVDAKGKGQLQTYWLKIGTESMRSERALSEPVFCKDKYKTGAGRTETTRRLVEWNHEQLLRILKEVVAVRQNSAVKATKTKRIREMETARSKKKNMMVLDEVTEIITLPKFENKMGAEELTSPESVDLGLQVEVQLEQFISFIAAAYLDNPFHNFEHASHVAMSVNKLLSRIVAPDVSAESTQMASVLHDHTYGITSDPLTHFAVVFSALMHDVDHPGVPNGQLATENPVLAQRYKGKSIAEQNSVDVTWSHFMSENFKELRACIYSNTEEYKRFRQIVVNSVMATDIFDKELSALRKGRWDRAFSKTHEDLDSRITVNRKATIVIEHVIQASDVAHTMQHWHVYIKWNSRLFNEMYLAFLTGRTDKDPSDGWFKGEIWFFDCYVIPLAKKLESCGVFGVSSDECLAYAEANRKEWEEKGTEIVADMIQRARAKYTQEARSSRELTSDLPKKNLVGEAKPFNKHIKAYCGTDK